MHTHTHMNTQCGEHSLKIVQQCLYIEFILFIYVVIGRRDIACMYVMRWNSV